MNHSPPAEGWQAKPDGVVTLRVKPGSDPFCLFAMDLGKVSRPLRPLGTPLAKGNVLEVCEQSADRLAARRRTVKHRAVLM
jgi:hypothetical protein